MYKMLKIKKLHVNAKLPERGTVYAAGYDLFTCEEQKIKPGLNKIPLGFSMQIPPGHYARIACRSSLAANNMSVEAGVIDEDYRGEIIVLLRWHHPKNKQTRDVFMPYPRGRKIAQMIITPYAAPQVEEVDSLSDSERGAGGFGSTGAYAVL
jgi:dUTP pyrophosphatase